MVHICNPSYSVGRDQEDHHGLKAAPGKELMRLYLKTKQQQKNPSQERTAGVAQMVRAPA
jgi:hypothetical protein